MTCRIAILISGRGSNMEAIIDHIARERADVEVTFVGADKPSAAGLQIAADRKIKIAVLPYSQGRAAGEAELEKLWQLNSVDYLVLAGFMRLISPEFVQRHRGKILNIHPALLPNFPGAHAISDFWASGEPVGGVTVHYVDEEMDHGPIILQSEVARTPDDTIETFETKIHKTEHQLYWQALKTIMNQEAHQ
ncbi:MAG: phosphoribosylglycinamide formyltransferase [Pyramidobacter sp.]|nr:phosphoribosylglycinamide formyltransferase [Pyramidobacter sp.]